VELVAVEMLASQVRQELLTQVEAEVVVLTSRNKMVALAGLV
jgi:hypothetical protein